jgi:predicted nuclease with TOPRIM domain
MKKIKLTEQGLHKLIRTIVEQVEETYLKVPADQYLDLLEKTSNNPSLLARIKTFKGKSLIIVGNLKLRGLPIDNLGNIKVVQGSLDISDTNIRDLKGVEVTGYVTDWNTPFAKIRERAQERKKYEEAENNREDDVWNRTNENIDDVGLKANALFQFLVGEGEIQELTEDDIAEIETLQNRSNSLQERFAETEDPEETNRLRDEISDIDERIDEIRGEKQDIYNIIKTNYDNYGLTHFEVLGLGREYSVGTEDEMDESAYEYVESMFDDIGVEGYRQSFLEDHIDVYSLVSYVEDWITYDVTDSPESYFSDDDYQLTEEQEERKEQLENEITEYEERLSEYEEDSPEYEQIQEHLEALQEELDGIEVDTEPTEEMIDKVVQDKIEDIKYDPLSYINDMGLNLADFIDKEGLIKAVVEEDGYGVMSSYDGSVDEERIGGETYYIIRTE